MKKFVLGLVLILFLSVWNITYAHGPDEGYSMGPWMSMAWDGGYSHL
jgi:hypothetical protein